MGRWRKGESTVDELLTRGQLERITADTATAHALLDASSRHVASAAAVAAGDPEGAYALAYDSCRKAATALLAHQGLRPTTRGGHLAVVDATTAQFPGVAGLRSLDRLRRRRHQGEYPDPAGYDAITTDEAHDAIDTANTTITAARTLLAAPQLGVF